MLAHRTARLWPDELPLEPQALRAWLREADGGELPSGEALVDGLLSTLEAPSRAP